MANNEPLVKVTGLSKSFNKGKRVALSDVNFTISRGEIVGLAGPDGAGKTTLIRLIAGLLKPTAGRITVDGFDSLTQASNIHDFTRYMPQRFGLYEDLSVQQNLNLYAELTGVTGEERQATMERLLHFTELGPFVKRLAGQLSGGMKQKLGLACSLIKQPTLLLLDEPTVGVDPLSRRELWSMVSDLLVQGITVLWSTSYLDEAERCHSVLLLNEGKLLYDGPPEAMTNRMAGRVFSISHLPSNRRSALTLLLDDPNVVDGAIQGQDLRIVVRDPSLPLPDKEMERHLTTPRFEDAFIDLLGGGPGGRSRLAEMIPQVKTATPEVIRCVDLTKQFGEFTAVNHISFQVESGTVFGLLGPNGAGKSTTFKMLCGLLNATSGEAYVNGLELKRASGVARAQIGHMAQKFSLYGNLSVRQNLDLFARVYGLTRRQQRDRIDKMIEIFELDPYLSDSADSLPLGFKQRLALSCATIHEPPILFLDEPTAGVDPITRREFWTHINGMVQKGVTVIVTSHFMDEAEYCDQIALIYQGTVIQMGTPDELKSKAKSEERPNPTLEDTFIYLIEQHDQDTASQSLSR
jgi:drug efflux transport system ATP-binding protein